MTTAKNGLSAITLQRTLGTSYRTAWTMLHRYRTAMVRSERKQLSGIVEIDECLVGGVDHGGKRGRGTDKAIIVIAIEIKDPVGYGRVRMRAIFVRHQETCWFHLSVMWCLRELLYKQMAGVAIVSCKRMAMYTKKANVI